MQSKAQSAVETMTATLIGYLVAVITQQLILPIFEIHVTTTENMQIALIFTFVSLVRGYLIRRFFNWLN